MTLRSLRLGGVYEKRVRWHAYRLRLATQFSTEVTNKQQQDNDEATKRRPKSVSFLKSCSDLSKLRLSALVVSTTAAGYLAAGPIMDLNAFYGVLVGTGLCSSSAAAWNQILEVDRDKRMKRTLQRPLVTGSLSLDQARLLATSAGVAGTSILYTFTDPITTALGAANIGLYAGLYTYLKPRSPINTWVGAVVGAIPPVMGYTAATSGVCLDLIPISLASLLYFWQLPHFMALSYMYKLDYKRGGFQMLSLVDEPRTANVVVHYTYYLAAIPFVTTLLDVTHLMFTLEGLVLNGYAISVAHRFRNDRTNANARHVFLTSLWHLPCTLMLFLLHSKTWNEESRSKNAISVWIQKQIRWARQRGRELCVHEQTKTDDQPCPVVVVDTVVSTTKTDSSE